MSGLDLQSTPFAREIAAVTGSKTQTPCRCYDLEFLVKGESYKPLAIMGVNNINDFIDAFYRVYAFQFKTTAAIREVLIKNNASIEAVLKVYEIGRNTTYSATALKNPKIRRFKAKLYLEESDYITQNNPAVNDEAYLNDKSLVDVKVQLVEKGFEQLKSRHVGGTYSNISGYNLLRHLVDYHANLDNDDVNSLINGVDIAPNYSTEVKSQIAIEQGTNLIEAMHLVNNDGGGLWATGFSYYIHNQTWYIFPPFSLKRFNDNVKRLIIVNLPKDRVPGLEVTYHDSESLLTILSTRDVTVQDKREARKLSFGTGLRFADAARLLNGFAETIDNKLKVDASKNVNDLIVSKRDEDVQQIRFAQNKLTSAKNIELSKLAPSKGFMMRISWENSDDSLIYPGMPVKVLYLKKKKPMTVIGTVVNVESSDYPAEQSFPPKKFSQLSYIQVFVGDLDQD
mgnify:FL=1